MTIADLTEIYKFFVHGLVIGGLLSAMPFIVGKACSIIFKVIMKGA